jgi:single-strand DNA-binding protein
MASLNKIMLIGNVGTDPEMRYTPSGNPVTSFPMATSRRYTDSSGERREETEWFRIVVFGKQAESCNQFVTKGKQVYVEGRLRTRNWEGQDGQKRVSVEVMANRVLFLGRRALAPLPEEGELEPEDLPFEQSEGIGS